MVRRGIILAGGRGTRLYPATRAVSKGLLPVFDKPMIYYPLTTLMQAGIRDVLVIGRPHEIPLLQACLETGRQWGISISYASQSEPRGIADAFLLGDAFVDGEPVCLILGDNLFHGPSLDRALNRAACLDHGAEVFCHRVEDPQRYGVAELDETGAVIHLQEKPPVPRSNHAVTGLYFYDRTVCQRAAMLRPSCRGELEITDINKQYLEEGSLRAQVLDDDLCWFDAGTHDSLLEASAYMAGYQERSHRLVGCPEQAAFQSGWISPDDVLEAADAHDKTGYGKLLRGLVEPTVDPSPAKVSEALVV